MHKVLEYTHIVTDQLDRDRQLGLQSNVLKECERASQHTWLLIELDRNLEISLNEETGYAYGAHLQSLISRMQPRRADSGYWCRRRDVKILERFPTKKGS